jgi:hypothetical protein
MTFQLEGLENRWLPTTLIPTTFDDGGLGSGSLRDAVLQFNADTGTQDDTIQLLPGTYSLTIKNTSYHQSGGLDGDLYLTQASHRWIIQGAGPSTIIDASKLQDRVFQIVTPNTQVVFLDLVIQGGLAQDNGTPGAKPGTTDALGGGVLNNGGDITLDDVVLQNNTAQGGTGFYGYDARGGGLFSTGGSVTISDSRIIDNQVMGGNGRSGFTTAWAGGAGAGGGIYSASGSLTIADTAISGNRATGGNGGNITCGSCSEVYGGDGGTSLGSGLYLNGGMLTLADSTISTNTLQGGAGGSAPDGGSNGGASRGGGAYGNGILSISNSTIAANFVQGGAGGEFGRFGGFGGLSQGGGLYVSGTLTVRNSTIATNTLRGGDGASGNFAVAGNGGLSQGGGVFLSGTLTLSNSTIAANILRAGDGGSTQGRGGNGGLAEGGGLWLTYDSTQISFSTIAANQARGGTHGIGHPDGTDGPAAGGGINDVYYLYLLQTRDTILAQNTVDGLGTNSGPDLAGNLGSLGHNLVGNSQGGSGFDPTDLLNVDPLLGPLQNNGGPTQTMALLVGSPALNAGDPGQLGVPDQRGVVRSGGVNIGAFQASATAFLLDAPATVTAGVPFDVTVTAVDPFGQVAVGYSGIVTFSTTDPGPGVVLPADYTFTLDDGGMHTFTDTGLGEITLVTPGDQLLTVTDTADATITGSATVTVEPGGSAPTLCGSPRPCGPGTPGDTTPLQNVQSSSGNAGVQRFFAAPAEEAPMSTWRRWPHTDPGEPAGWIPDHYGQEDLLFI